MRTSQVKILLSELEGFEDPDPELEQYITPPEVAADFLNIVRLERDSKRKEGRKEKALDLGSGTGMITIGLALFGFQAVGIEKDHGAVETARGNLERVEDQVGKLPVRFLEKDMEEVEQKGDFVVMNPPFGLQEGSNRDKNLDFLEKGFETAGEVFALLHSSDKKTGETRQFIKEFGLNRGFEVKLVKTYVIELPDTMEFHERSSKEVKTDLYCFSKR
ncbi:MAG: methyltransferase [Candidatus Nanohaloarchaea archaeon]|nr:methyltransferase [Candidatus Nanohaloarchaea archaeon]